MAERTVFVFAYLPGQLVAVPAGELTFVEDGARVTGSRFVYGTKYMARKDALEVDPVALPFRSVGRVPGEVIVPPNGLELFGGIADAGPDSWGRRIVEIELKAPPDSLSEADYLIHAGTNRVGALDIRPALDSPPKELALLTVNSLEQMVDAAQRLESGERVSQSIVHALQPGTHMGGARPKAVIEHNNSLWLAKFPSRTDAFNIPRVEFATMKLAQRCGLDVPEVDTVSLGNGRDVLLVRRFDRTWNGKGYVRYHYVSALTMLARHESESIKSSYVEITDVIRRYVVPSSIRKNNRELFGRMVFNILCTNNDDHLKNHGFRWTEEGFVLAPLFDVVPKPELGSERNLHLSVGALGRAATLPNALSKHAAFDITLREAVETMERIVAVVREWKGHFEELKVGGRDIDAVDRAFRRAKDIGLDEVRKTLKRDGRAAEASAEN